VQRPGGTEITLRSADAEARILPAWGAALAHWRVDGADILRPRVAASCDPTDLACFVMAPFSNVIGGSTLRFRGAMYPIPVNHPKESLPIHGDAWLGAWRVGRVTEDAAVFHYDHEGLHGFPFRYRVTQRVKVRPTSLALSLRLKNTDRRAMPGGLGVHPYFLRSPDARLEAGHRGLWTGHRAQSDARFLREEALHDHAIDDCFTEWSRTACLTLPERKRRIRIKGSSSATALVVYAPRAADFICIELVTHVNDGINALAAGNEATGIRVLEPGESMRLDIEFQVSMLAERSPG
jgi:aldose 1-epimerase